MGGREKIEMSKAAASLGSSSRTISRDYLLSTGILQVILHDLHSRAHKLSRPFRSLSHLQLPILTPIYSTLLTTTAACSATDQLFFSIPSVYLLCLFAKGASVIRHDGVELSLRGGRSSRSSRGQPRRQGILCAAAIYVSI